MLRTAVLSNHVVDFAAVLVHDLLCWPDGVPAIVEGAKTLRLE